MTGRQKIEAAFLKEGTSEIPAVICYDNLLIRDHWKELTSCPFWYQEAAEIELQLKWHREVANRLGQDWFPLTFIPLYSKEDRKNITIEVRPGEVLKVNKRTGSEERLEIEPDVGGQRGYEGIEEHKYLQPETLDQIDELIPVTSDFDSGKAVEDGRMDLSSMLVKEFSSLYPLYHIGSPLSACATLWGIEGMMIKIATESELVKHACKRYLESNINIVQKAASMGAKGIWIEECYTEMISPEAFKTLNVPFMRQLINEIRSAGLKSIYYYTGNPAKKMDYIVSVGSDALAFEESKKNFIIDIEDIVEVINKRCTILGNLDSISILQDGTEEQLRAEISRQIAAGRRNGSRFIMSLGSPITPITPVERVRLYCDLVHELGKRP